MASKLKPKMLKEFLGDTANYDSSSNGFDSHPRSLPDCYSDPNFRRLLEQGKAGNNDRLPRSRSRSRAAAEAAVSSFQKLLNAVKSLQYSSTPSTLPRSLSRRFLDKWPMKKKKSNSSSSSNDVASGGGGSKIVVVTVKVKDILRWRSFHHHHHHQVSESEEERESQASVLVGPAFDAPSTSDASVDDIFTVTEEEEEEGEDDYLPCCRDDDAGEKWVEVVASDSEVGPKEGYHKISSEEDTVQQSPVSILDSPFRDEVSDEENLSTFDQSLANMERTKQRLLQSLQLFESLAGVHDDDDDDDEETEEELPREDDDTVKAKSRGFCWFERGGEGLKDKQKCIRSMELQGQWSKFEDERPEIGIELEDAILNDLLDEVLFDLC